MIRTKGEAGTGNVVEAVRHLKTVNRQLAELASLEGKQLKAKAEEYRVPLELVDRAGNRAVFTRTFRVKTTGPLVEILLGGVPLGSGKTFFAPITPEIRTNEPLSGPGAATLAAGLVVTKMNWSLPSPASCVAT